MKGAGAAGRIGVIMLASVLGLSACRDNGLPDRNLPLDDARNRQYSYPGYQPAAESAPVAVAGRAYIGGAPSVRIPARLLTPVGDAQGTMLYAVSGAKAPYARLYASVGNDEWRPYLRLN
jgi:hypothetical protein